MVLVLIGAKNDMSLTKLHQRHIFFKHRHCLVTSVNRASAGKPLGKLNWHFLI